MKPLLLFGVLYVFFVVISHVGSGGKPDERFYGVQLLGLDHPVHLLRRSHWRGGTERRGPREPGSQDPVPAPGHPPGDRAAGLFNLMMNLIVVLIFALISACIQCSAGSSYR